MKPRAVVVDLDGTLLDSSGRVPERTRDVLDRVRRKGIPVLVATGRPLAGALQVLEGVAVDPVMAVYNGSQLFNRETDQTLHAYYLPTEIVETVRDRFEEGRHDHFVYHEEIKYLRSLRYHECNEALTGIFVNVRRVEDRCHVPEGPFPRVSTYGRQEDLVGIPELLKTFEGTMVEVFPCSAITAFPFPEMWYLEVQAACAGKKEILDWLERTHGIPASQVAAFGDQSNDLGLLRAAGMSFAVANAFAQVKEVVDEVIGSNDDEAVADKLEEWFLQ